MIDVEHVQQYTQPRYEIVDYQAITYPDETIFILLMDRKKGVYNFYITDHFDENIIFEDSSRTQIWVFIKTHEPETFEVSLEFYPWLKKEKYRF